LTYVKGFFQKNTYTGADPGFQVRGGALKKIAPSGGRRENFWGISCEKSRFYAKKIIFFLILGGARAGCAPPESAPDIYIYIQSKREVTKDQEPGGHTPVLIALIV
jgi:hypothetical protein